MSQLSVKISEIFEDISYHESWLKRYHDLACVMDFGTACTDLLDVIHTHEIFEEDVLEKVDSVQNESTQDILTQKIHNLDSNFKKLFEVLTVRKRWLESNDRSQKFMNSIQNVRTRMHSRSLPTKNWPRSATQLLINNSECQMFVDEVDSEISCLKEERDKLQDKKINITYTELKEEWMGLKSQFVQYLNDVNSEVKEILVSRLYNAIEWCVEKTENLMRIPCGESADECKSTLDQLNSLSLDVKAARNDAKRIVKTIKDLIRSCPNMAIGFSSLQSKLSENWFFLGKHLQMRLKSALYRNDYNVFFIKVTKLLDRLTEMKAKMEPVVTVNSFIKSQDFKEEHSRRHGILEETEDELRQLTIAGDYLVSRDMSLACEVGKKIENVQSQLLVAFAKWEKVSLTVMQAFFNATLSHVAVYPVAIATAFVDGIVMHECLEKLAQLTRRMDFLENAYMSTSDDRPHHLEKLRRNSFTHCRLRQMLVAVSHLPFFEIRISKQPELIRLIQKGLLKLDKRITYKQKKLDYEDKLLKKNMTNDETDHNNENGNEEPMEEDELDSLASCSTFL